MIASIIQIDLAEKGGIFINYDNMEPICRNDLKNILKKYYNKIEHLPNYDEILRCEKQHDNKTYQIYYYDFSMNWLQQDFNIKKYLDTLLMEDYYSNICYLQWNYYLVLLYNCDYTIERKKINDIQRNEEFALKFVVDYKNLSEWLSSKYDFAIKEQAKVSQDLGILWMNKLKDNKLDCIYSRNIRIEDGISNYIEGHPILNQLDEASRLYQRALNIFEDSLGENHRDTAIVLIEIAKFNSQMEKYEESLALFKRALKILKSLLEPNDPYIIMAEQNIRILKNKLDEK